LIERLAAIEHERWSHWQRYLHSKGRVEADGSLTLPAELVSKWARQMATPYAALSDEEKQSDRDQVDRYLPVVLAHFGNGEGQTGAGSDP
jgi:hypothetical protein